MGSRFEGTVHHGGKAWWQLPEAADHVELQLGSRERWKLLLSLLSLFCFSFFLGTQPMRGCCHIQGGFSLSYDALETSRYTHSLPGDSKSSQGDHRDSGRSSSRSFQQSALPLGSYYPLWADRELFGSLQRCSLAMGATKEELITQRLELGLSHEPTNISKNLRSPPLRL